MDPEANGLTVHRSSSSMRWELPCSSAGDLDRHKKGMGIGILVALGFSPPTAALQVEQASRTPPPARYNVAILEDLGTPQCALLEQAVAINAAGETVGTVCADGAARAAHWSAQGKLTQLAPSDAPGDSFAYDLNDHGVVVGGMAQGEARTAFLWSAERGRTELDLGPGAVPLGINASGTVAFSLPSLKEVVGATWSEAAGVSAIRGLRGDVLVRAIGPSGSVAGICGGGATPARGFLLRGDGTLLELAAVDGFLHSHG